VNDSLTLTEKNGHWRKVVNQGECSNDEKTKTETYGSPRIQAVLASQGFPISRQRLHSTIGFLSPSQFEDNFYLSLLPPIHA
jgi:hypothetical protein